MFYRTFCKIQTGYDDIEEMSDDWIRQMTNEQAATGIHQNRKYHCLLYIFKCVASTQKNTSLSLILSRYTSTYALPGELTDG